ncbi:MAG: cupin domain-containing protein [Chloroflexi bacterium]|nr:cupin domain-containing protein [Chloroflexota bacterium]
MVMEREMMREKEEEPEEWYPPDYVYITRDEQHAHIASLPRVVHTGEVTKRYRSPKGKGERLQAKKGGVSIFLPWQHHNWKQMRYPIYTMTIFGQAGRAVEDSFAVGASGCHRHWMDAIFYRPGGTYIEEQDGVMYDCQGEGVLLVPTYSIHGHYFKEAPKKNGITVLPRIFEYIGIADMEVFDFDEEYKRKASPIGTFHIIQDVQDMMYNRRAITKWNPDSDDQQPKTVYDHYLKDVVDENRWRMQTVRWVPADSVPWEQTRQGKLKYLVHPWTNTVTRTMDCYLQEIPPGGCSGKHRHVYEEAHFICEGTGYTVQNGVRYDWKEDDLVCVPVGVTHQHFNADPEKKARIFGAHPRIFYHIGYGGIEQLENAPDWPGK